MLRGPTPGQALLGSCHEPQERHIQGRLATVEAATSFNPSLLRHRHPAPCTLICVNPSRGREEQSNCNVYTGLYGGFYPLDSRVTE
jgi:hypothetical protein